MTYKYAKSAWQGKNAKICINYSTVSIGVFSFFFIFFAYEIKYFLPVKIFFSCKAERGDTERVCVRICSNMCLNNIELNNRNSKSAELNFKIAAKMFYILQKLVSNEMSIAFLMHFYRLSWEDSSTLSGLDVILVVFEVLSTWAFCFGSTLFSIVITLGFARSSCFSIVLLLDALSSHSSSTSSSLRDLIFGDRFAVPWDSRAWNSCRLGNENVGSFVGAADSSKIWRYERPPHNE